MLARAKDVRHAIERDVGEGLCGVFEDLFFLARAHIVRIDKPIIDKRPVKGAQFSCLIVEFACFENHDVSAGFFALRAGFFKECALHQIVCIQEIEPFTCGFYAAEFACGSFARVFLGEDVNARVFRCLLLKNDGRIVC